MTEIDFLGVTLDVCPATGGIWFDQGELGRIRSASAEHFAHLDSLAIPNPEALEMPDGLEKLCPSCGTALEPYRFMVTSSIVLDTCNRCGGVFVEEGELDAMHDFIAAKAAGRGLPSGTCKEATERAAAALAIISTQQVDSKRKSEGICGVFRILASPVPWLRRII